MMIGIGGSRVTGAVNSVMQPHSNEHAKECSTGPGSPVDSEQIASSAPFADDYRLSSCFFSLFFLIWSGLALDALLLIMMPS